MSNLNTNGQKKFGVIDYVWLVLSVIGIVCLVLACRFKEKDIIASFIFGLLSGLILASLYLHILIKQYLNGNHSCEMKVLIAFLVNLIFPMAPKWFIDRYPENSSYLCIKTSIVIALILILIITYCTIKTKIKYGDDISSLKITCSLLIVSFVVLKFLFKEKSSFIDDNYLLPLPMLQLLYNLFDRKIKQKCKEHAAASETAS